MAKDKAKNQNWETDVRKGMEQAKKTKQLREQIKEDADKRKIGGFNPGDLMR